ncbi:hypothetical protein Tco_0798492 [Tanacetum coccineum]
MAKDDPTLTIMRFIPQHEIGQKYDAILPDTITNQAIKELDAYKTYYDLATRKVIPKPKYVRRSTREKTDQAPKASLSKRLKATAKVAKLGKKKLPTQGLETLSEIAMFEADQMKLITKRSKTQFHSSHASGSGANEGIGVSLGVLDVPTYGYEDEQISWKSSDEDDDDEVSISKDDDDQVNQGYNVEEEKLDEEKTNEFKDRVKSLEDDFSKFKQINLFVKAVSLIPGIVDKYLANKMNKAVKAAVQLQSDRLREEAHAENEDFINKIDENIKKFIKEQVKVQVKEQVSKILPRIKKSVSKQIESEVLIRSSNEAKTSHVVAANLSEIELKKILIDKMENNKSIDRSVQQKTLYKALVDIEMMRMKTKNPPLDQTGGPREEELEKDLSPLVHQRRRLPSQLASLKKRPNFIKSLLTINMESARDYYSRNRIIAIKKLTIVEWHNYKHLEWITVRRDDDMLYTFKEGDYNRLHL